MLKTWFGLYLEGILHLEVRGFAAESAALEEMWVPGEVTSLQIHMLPRNTRIIGMKTGLPCLLFVCLCILYFLENLFLKTGQDKLMSTQWKLNAN